MKKTVVISAFTCCGKTYAFENYQDRYSILDNDSSQFSWCYEYEPTDSDNIIKYRNPEFPKNYIEHIKENIGKADIIFVSSHLQVRQAMTDAGIRFCTVYPNPVMRNEWIERMCRRGDNKSFIDFQIRHWYEFMNNIRSEPHGFGIYRLGNNEYLDVELLDKILEQ